MTETKQKQSWANQFGKHTQRSQQCGQHPRTASWQAERVCNKSKVFSGRDYKQERRAMRAGNGGKLNPTWVEWLMGFPTGWTDLED
jgi:hypothetical protein